jgi:hypothetical protein
MLRLYRTFLLTRRLWAAGTGRRIRQNTQRGTAEVLGRKHERRGSRRGVAGCLGCDPLAARRELPGGIVHQTSWWAVGHVVGSMNLGTLIVAPREHIVAVAAVRGDGRRG